MTGDGDTRAGNQPVEPGTRLGQFELVGKLGAGGMGEVWEAIDSKLERRVALKLVRPELAVGATRSEWTATALPRLRAEAQAMAKLQHPNIATIYDIDAVGDRVFIAMELLSEGNLRQWTKVARPWREIVKMYVAAGRGLAAAHRAGLVHCDFKPDNVLLGANGEVRVSDFGVARELASGSAETREGHFAGTPGYMAPEQITGRGLDARADQFSFCVALWEALSGSRPFEVTTVTGVPTIALRLAAITRPAAEPRLASIPRSLERVIRRGLSASPSKRFSTMNELVDALERAAREPDRRRRLIVLGVAGVAVVGVALVAVTVFRQSATPDDPCPDLAHTASHDVWHESKTDLLRAAFATTQLPYAEAFADRTINALVTWRTQWRGARVELCRAERAGTGSANALTERAACLDDQLVQMRGRVERLTTAVTPKIVDRALQIVELRPEECLRLAGGMPDDPRQRARVAEIGRRLAELDDARLSSRAIAPDTIATLIADADQAGWPALANRVRVSAGLLAKRDGDCKRAIELTTTVAETAASAGQFDLESRAWEVRLECFGRLDQTAGLDHAIIAARAVAARLRGTIHEVRLATMIAEAQAMLGRLADAEKACLEALALAEARADDTGDIANAHQCLVGIHVQRGESAAAVKHAEAAVAARRRVFGDNHVYVANELDALAVAYSHATRLADAIVAVKSQFLCEQLTGKHGLLVVHAAAA